MFDRGDGPRLFGLPPGADFGARLIEGIEDRLSGCPPEALAGVTLIVNTHRLARRIEDVWSGRGPRLLPRIVAFADLATAFPVAGLPPPQSALGRKLHLARLIRGLIAADPDVAPPQAAFALADSLAALLDEMQGEGVAPATVAALDVSDMSGHWARSLGFIGIAARYLAAIGQTAADPEARQRLATEALCARWQSRPPQGPVLVAGSTGSRATTRMLMATVAGLPQGAVILPGFDFAQPDPIWDALARGQDDHPQARFAHLLRDLHQTRDAVRPWSGDDGCTGRNRLVSLALRPAPVTDQWLRDGPALGDLVAATDGLSLIEAPDQRTEAQAIALCLRQAVEDGTPAALVSPDRVLTRRVAAALDRWGIEPDDSAGRPLALSAPGRFLSHIAGLLGADLTAEALIVLLKHPLTATSEGLRGAHLLRTRELELFLRAAAPGDLSLDDLGAWAAARNSDDAAWGDWLCAALAPLLAKKTASVAGFTALCRDTAEALSAGPGATGTGALWQKAAGEAAFGAMADLSGAGTDDDDLLSAADYRALLASVLNGRQVRDPVAPHPGVMIWGTLEARVQGARRVILGGLNDGVWPEQAAPDPWLNRSLRREAGLLLPERRIGLSAHDFQQAVAAPEVIITRSRRDADSETVPSRWLNRLTNLLQGLTGQGGDTALAAMRARGDAWIAPALVIDHRAPASDPARRPAPCPPVHRRPSRLSVTEIQTLIRDPFAIYARHVLSLRPLNPLGRLPDAALRGSAFHKVMERAHHAGIDPDDPAARDRLLAIGHEVFSGAGPWPAAERLWLGRLDRIAGRFLAGERRRLADGRPYPPERKGRMTLDDIGFTLTGTADRIDLLSDGRLAIFDYKTGQMPSPKDVTYFDKQLFLEAVMAEAGGFEDVPPAQVAALAYISLNPTAPDRQVLSAADGPDEAVAETLRDLRRLISAYAAAAKGYPARRAPRSTAFSGDYDHLARYGEWDDTDDPVPEAVDD